MSAKIRGLDGRTIRVLPELEAGPEDWFFECIQDEHHLCEGRQAAPLSVCGCPCHRPLLEG